MKELDHIAAHNPGGDLARAVAVVHNLLRASLEYQAERAGAENIIRQQAEQISRLSAEIDQLRAPAAARQPYPEMPPSDLEHNSYSRAAVKAAMKDAHDRGYSVGWDHGHEHAVTASAPVAGWSLRGPSAGNWRDEFSRRVYEDLAAADNQDVPLEEYPARILGVLDALASAPVADESPMAKMAEALREKARQEQQAYQDRRNQATEWGPMPHGTEADLPASAPVAGEAQPVGYLQAASEVGSVGMLKRFITADDFGGDDAALSAWAKSSGAAPLYATPQASPVAGHAFRALLDRSKVPGKDYLYCIKPSEIDAAIGEASAPTAAESLNRCEKSTPTMMEDNNGAARILADITLTGTTPAERFNEERKHFAWNQPLADITPECQDLPQELGNDVSELRRTLLQHGLAMIVYRTKS